MPSDARLLKGECPGSHLIPRGWGVSLHKSINRTETALYSVILSVAAMAIEQPNNVQLLSYLVGKHLDNLSIYIARVPTHYSAIIILIIIIYNIAGYFVTCTAVYSGMYVPMYKCCMLYRMSMYYVHDISRLVFEPL